MEQGELLTIKQAAAELEVSVMTVRRHIEAGDIVPLRPGREYLIHRDELNRYKTNRRRPGRPSKPRA